MWLKMVEKKPLLADPKATVTISVEVFQKMLRQFHTNGVELGKTMPSLFDNIFGTFGRNP